MPKRPWNPVLEHIRSLATLRVSPECDAVLLNRFICHHDEAAFELLLRRHGPMVLRVARRVVGNETDAEDVFQATFLVLARRGGAIRKREAVASWLHGVAHRLALSARRKRVRRQERERQAAEARSDESPSQMAWSELEETLHEVLEQMPDKYRTPLIYCYLEGWTQEEVARQLGKPLGTVRSWLARGRDLLRKRLIRRGISLTTEGTSAALLASACAPAEAVSTSLRMATLRAAQLFAGGGNAMTLLSPAVANLVRKGLTAMLLAKLKHGAALVLTLTLLIAGTGWAAHQSFRGNSPEVNEVADDATQKEVTAADQPRADAFGDPLPPGAVARLGTMRFRQESWLNGFALSPDGRTLAAAAGKSVAFWDFSTGRLTRRLAFKWNMRCLAFAPDGKSVAVGGQDCTVYLFDTTTGKELRRFVGHEFDRNRFMNGGNILAVFFSPDGRTLLSWGSDKTVRVWDTLSGQAQRQIDTKGATVRKLSLDGRLLVVEKAGDAKILQLLDAATGNEVRQLAHPLEVSGVACSPDGKTLAVACGTSGKPSRITLWELDTGKQLCTLAGPKDAMFGLAFSPDGKMLAAAGHDKTNRFCEVRLWDVASQKELREPQRLSWAIHGLAFGKDGKTLISSGPDNRVHVWDAATGQERIPADGPTWAIADIAYSSDGKLIAAPSSTKIWLWSPATGKVVRVLETKEEVVTRVSFSADGKLLISGSHDGTLRFWDLKSGKEQNRIAIGNGWIEQSALSPDGKMLAVWGEVTARQVHLLDAMTGAKLRVIEVPAEQPGVIATVNSLCFSPDGKTLHASSGTHIFLLRWDVATGKPLPFFGKHDGGLSGLAMSPDGRSVAATTLDGSLYLWECATGQQRFVSKDAGHADAVAFSPDGQWLAVVNTGNHTLLRGNEVIPQGVQTREQVRLVRVSDGKVIHRFSGHLGGIGCLRFSPDARTLASGGHDSTVLVWDVTDRTVPRAGETQPLPPEKLADLWQELRGTADEAHGCMWTLISSPNQAVPFLSEKLKPVAVLDEGQFARLLKKLESDQFAQREQATQELKRLGDSMEFALRKALQQKPPAETQRRLQALLDDLDGVERLRTLRAIEALERIGDKASRDVLRRLSEGAAGAWLTEEARMSFRRLERREK